tara:strand:- start:4602 stop:4811 length:210 start_codon:yes stop_codon:yes gene_type:complete
MFKDQPKYLEGDLVRAIKRLDKDVPEGVGIIVKVEKTVGKLSKAVPYSYLVRWPDNTMSEWSSSSIERV